MNNENFKWEDFNKIVSIHAETKEQYYYRGQNDYDYKLIDSFRRTKPSDPSLSYYRSEILPKVKQEFVKRGFSTGNSEADFLAILQHHGFPTPLLDWTCDPFVAAYFACREDNNVFKNKDVAIFFFKMNEWKSSHSSEHVECIEDLLIDSTGNVRFTNQRAKGTIVNVNDGLLSTMLKNSFSYPSIFLRQFILPASEKINVLKELDARGYNESTMFPPTPKSNMLDGLCKELKNIYFPTINIKEI